MHHYLIIEKTVVPTTDWSFYSYIQLGNIQWLNVCLFNIIEKKEKTAPYLIMLSLPKTRRKIAICPKWYDS